MLKCDRLSKKFESIEAVRAVSLTVHKGETYGLLGPNGAGKTTTISMIVGVLKADAGSIEVDGKAISPGSREGKAAIGFVPQEIALYPDLTARENLQFFGRLEQMGSREIKKRTEIVLELVGLSERANDRLSTYSGGMKRRVNIAVGLLHDPKLLVLDEPTVGVDPQSRNQILEGVEELSRLGMSVLYTTHYMEEAQRLCSRVGIMDYGAIIAEGSPTELIGRHGGSTQISMKMTGMMDRFRGLAEAIPGVSTVVILDGGAEISGGSSSSLLPDLITAVAKSDGIVTALEAHEPDLESVFLNLTGRAIRD